MLFNSYEFIFIFLPLVWFIYFYLNSKRVTKASKLFLVFASLFFYSWWNIIYLPIILFSILFNFNIAKLINRAKNYKKRVLIFGIAFNLFLLGYFKYMDFFITNINLLSASNIELLHLTLPLAISFFTFQQISYLVDSYRDEKMEYDILNYSLFVTFFPQLIAGPIVHHKEMMPQFTNLKNSIKNYHNITLGFFIFSMGLFKKVVIADSFAPWATNGFDEAEKLNLIEAWVTSLSYTFQIYFDFSGYTDMAIGLALLFNIKLPINFNSPYKSTNIQEFWRRWHITLSRFLRDYLYIPLGGSRVSEYRVYINIMLTFILGGLWHGAGWTFLFWGFLHGLALVVYRVWSSVGFRLGTLLSWFITFNFINISWIFFRAKEWDDATKVLRAMFSLDYVVLPAGLASRLSFFKEYGIEFGYWLDNIQGNIWTIICLITIFAIITYSKNSLEHLNSLKINYRSSIFIALLFSIGILSLSKVSEFLYFNF